MSTRVLDGTRQSLELLGDRIAGMRLAIADIAESDRQALATMLTVATERFLDAGHTGSYLLDLGQDMQMTVRFDDGRLSVEPPGPAGCEICADPVSWLLVCLGRINQGQAVALGVVRFNGANPDLAAGFLNKLYSF